MSTAVQGRPVTAALLELIDDADVLVAAGIAPDGGGWSGAPGASDFTPYAILYSVPGATDGPMDDSAADGAFMYQVTGVGSTIEQAEWVADTVRTALAGQRPTAGDQQITLITVAVLSDARRDDDEQPPVFFTTDRFRVLTTPTSTGS